MNIKNIFKCIGVLSLSSPFIYEILQKYPIEHWFDYITIMLISLFFVYSAIALFFNSERNLLSIIVLFVASFVSYMLSLFLIKGNVPFVLFVFVGIIIAALTIGIYFGLQEIKRIKLLKEM